MVERPGGKLLGLARVVERGRVEKITEQKSRAAIWRRWREQGGMERGKWLSLKKHRVKELLAPLWRALLGWAAY